MKKLLGIFNAVLLMTSPAVAVNDVVIQSIAVHMWTGQERSDMIAADVCSPPGKGMTQYSATGQVMGRWCCWGTDGQVTLTFTTPDPAKTYIVQWKPWVLSGPVVLDGVTYDNPQGWTAISTPLSADPSGVATFRSGIVEKQAGFFRILVK